MSRPGHEKEGDAMSVVSSMLIRKKKDGEAPDLDAARGLVPAIVVGTALWVIVVAVAVLIWG
jgi:hypothetical protein